MTLYVGNKRIVARAITFIDESVLLIERFRKENGVILHYFTIPGGGVEEGESFMDAAVRETMEETCCNIEIVKALETEDFGSGICHWFYGKYISGTPTLGGEEKERNTKENSYKVVLINMSDIEKINILGIGKKLIKQCFIEYKKNSD